MVAMASPAGEWVTIAEAVALAGCTEGYLRRLLLAEDKRLRGWKAGERAWLVRKEDVLSLRASLTTRSNLRRDERPAAAKAAKRRRKRAK
jgi:hypothetical protein